ncbi:MAG TPA: hypothetical protein ENL07_11780 [Chlorobaculum parvum]|uniref:Uncharacterized protein n=1 Tax=Chlorobaculum parvum TaxID=274539 RepID=A0A7C5HPB0_9CHLB|nr:hypothetical protein [Chlorobaculum parvum]
MPEIEPPLTGSAVHTELPHFQPQRPAGEVEEFGGSDILPIPHSDTPSISHQKSPYLKFKIFIKKLTSRNKYPCLGIFLVINGINNGTDALK